MDTVYSQPHNHWIYGTGHGHRVRATIELMRQRCLPVDSVADLSCGNGEVPRAAGARLTVLGDYAPRYEYSGRLEDNLPRIPRVDLYTCCETLEHLDDPDLALRLIREKATRLVLSTPIDKWDDGNGEHLWAWSRQDVEKMAEAAGFRVDAYDNVDALALYDETYNYGIWICS